MEGQTGAEIDINILADKADKVIMTLADNQTAKERFDLGEGANECDYIATTFLKRVLLSEDPEIVEQQEDIKSKLNQIKNQYL